MVTLSDEQFDLIYHTLEFANSGWTDDDIPKLVLLEAQAWELMQALDSNRH